MQKTQSDSKSLQTLVVWIFDEKGFDMLRVDEQKQLHILGEGEMENIVLKDLVQSLRGVSDGACNQNTHHLINKNLKSFKTNRNVRYAVKVSSPISSIRYDLSHDSIFLNSKAIKKQ